MLSTFLTCTGLFNFCSQNLYLAAIFLSMNIPIIPLSKSTFTITPLWVSTFSIPIFNHTSFNILNVFLTSLCLPSSLAVLFGGSLHALSGYILSCAGCTILLSFLLCLGHLHYLASSSFLSLRTPYPLLSFQCIPFFPHYLHSM